MLPIRLRRSRCSLPVDWAQYWNLPDPAPCPPQGLQINLRIQEMHSEWLLPVIPLTR